MIKWGKALVDTLYPDPATRRTLYQIGFTPYVGRQFQQISPQILDLLRGAANYAARTPEQRFNLFWQIGELVRGGRGFGYTGRNPTELALIPRWWEIAGWWLQRENAAAPPVEHLRRWQTFVANNLEFKLGVAVGAALAEAWNANAAPLAVPSLEEWRATTGLPWIGFWFRELIRWGTMEPFVAFAMAQGISGTREDAAALRPEFEAWLDARGEPVADEDRIDPQIFLAWSHARPSAPTPPVTVHVINATLQVAGSLERYAVRPTSRVGHVAWLDPAGFEVARSEEMPWAAADPERHDYVVANDTFGIRVFRSY